MPAPELRLGNWAVAARWPIIAATLFHAGLAASGTLFPEFSADYRIYASRDDPQRLASEARENSFGESGEVPFDIAREEGDAISAFPLEATTWLTERSRKVPSAAGGNSVDSFQHTAPALTFRQVRACGNRGRARR